MWTITKWNITKVQMKIDAVSYWAVCVSGGLLYVVFQELFSSSSPNKIYGKAFKKVQLDPEVRSHLYIRPKSHKVRGLIHVNCDDGGC